jgi:WD40 repeat protein
MVQAWSLSQPDWTCKIDEGSAGIAYARWSPDSRHILTTSEFQLRLTVWSLVNTACVHVQWPKHAARGVSFTKDGKFAAICTRRDCKDYINLLSCHSWEIMGVFAVDTLDLAGVEWSPDDSAIVAWDSLLEYKVHVLSLLKFPGSSCVLWLVIVLVNSYAYLNAAAFFSPLINADVVNHIHSCHVLMSELCRLLLFFLPRSLGNFKLSCKKKGMTLLLELLHMHIS